MTANSITPTQISDLVSKFKIDAEILSVKPFGSGHINDTYRVFNTDTGGHDYLLQRINHHVFRDVPLLMSNIVNVTHHLKKKLSVSPSGVVENAVLTVIETKDHKPFYKDAEG